MALDNEDENDDEDATETGEEGEDNAAPEAAIPTEPPPVPQSIEQDDELSAQSRRRGGNDGIIDAAREAYRVSQGAGIHAFGLKSKDAGLARRQHAYQSGMGAYDPENVKALADRIDPEHKMGAAERNIAVYGTLYSYYNERGDPDTAALAAVRLSQYYRQAFDHYKALAAVAAGKGDVRGTAFSILKAFENVPNGEDLRITQTKDGNLQVGWYDMQTGEQKGRKIIPPDDMLRMATGGMVLNWDQLMAAAGAKPAAPDKNAPSERFKENQRLLDAKKEGEIKREGLKPSEERVHFPATKGEKEKTASPSTLERLAAQQANREIDNSDETLDEAAKDAIINKWRTKYGLKPMGPAKSEGAPAAPRTPAVGETIRSKKDGSTATWNGKSWDITPAPGAAPPRNPRGVTTSPDAR